MDSIGKLPPQAIQEEEAILCCLLTDRDSIYEAIGKLKPEHFYKDGNQKIYQAILDLYAEHKGVDILTVTDQTRKNGTLDEVGGPVYISQLSTMLTSTRNLTTYIGIVIDTYNSRELIRILSTKSDECYYGEKDSSEIMSELETEIYRLSSSSVKKEPQNISEGLKQAAKNIEKFNEHSLTGVATPFTRLNTITGGWQASDLIIIGGRPSQGKTQFAIESILSAAESGVPTLFFSLEMSTQAISTRCISHETGISNEYIRKGLQDEDWLAVEKAIGKLERLPIFIDDTASINIIELISKAKRAVIKHHVGLIVIDYLGLMTIDLKGVSRDEKIGEITKALKGLAKDLNIPVILLSQLNRMVEMHGDKRPTLSNLRESGNIEQDADLVIFVHNPSYYKDPDYESEPYVLELIIGKHRNGRIETIKINRKPEWTAMYDYTF